MPTPLERILILFLFCIPSLSIRTSSSQSNILSACNATRYKSLCQSTLTRSSNLSGNPTAIDLIQASISASLENNEIAKLKIKAILNSSPKVPNANRTSVAENCIEGLRYCDRRLEDAECKVDIGGGRGVADARAWVSAASGYHFGCWQGLKTVNDTDEVADAIPFLENLTNITSNALSMITALQRYGNDTCKWTPPQTERDGYWGPPTAPTASGASIGSKLTVPSNLVPNVTVCADGCDYSEIQQAVESAPVHGRNMFVIYIKEGVYEEIVRVGFEKTNVVFLGDGMGKTVITGNLNAGMVGVSTYNTATVGVLGDGFIATNLTISNTAGPDAHQAVAFRSSSDLSLLEFVEFTGHQDTLYPNSLRQLYKSCVISGTVDFIFGGSASFFQDSLILIVPRQLNPDQGETNTVTAHGRTDPAQSTGFVLYNCVVNASGEYWKYYDQKPANHRNYLGRPWKEYSRTVFIDCYIEKIIRSEGWLNWIGDFALSTLFYGEFNSTGPGGNVSGRVNWSSQIPAEHLNVYSVQNFIQLE